MTASHGSDHPSYVEGCWLCRVASVSVSPSATPTRGQGTEAVRINRTEKRWDVDHAAYRRLRADGLQPRRVDGASVVEKRAETVADVERGLPRS